MKEKTLEEWHNELVALAERQGTPWAVSTDPEDHREGFDAGETPEDELQNQWDAAR